MAEVENESWFRKTPQKVHLGLSTVTFVTQAAQADF